jgi:hypothetical protein
MERAIDRFDSYMKRKGLTDSQVTKDLGLSNGLLGKSRKKDRDMSRNIANSAINFYEDLSAAWLLTGEGPMLVNNSENDLVNTFNASAPAPSPPSNIEEIKSYEVPLLPLDAIGGRLDGFAPNGVTISQCETITSPFKNAALAIRVKGQSMSPIYPSGCMLFIVKNNGGWLDWGKVYVLDTDNGVIVKQLSPSQKGEEYICCKSFNNSPEFAPFDIPHTSIYGIYRVLGAMTEL